MSTEIFSFGTGTVYKMSDLQAAYDKAVTAGEDQFTFHGHELVTDYAKYLLEYLNA
jgi:hypothetical protein